MKYVYFIFIIFFLIESQAQDSTFFKGKYYKLNRIGSRGFIQLSPNDTTYIIIEELPEFPGGKSNIAAYIKGEAKYPQSAKKDNIHGKVILNFIVLETGYIDSVKVVQSVRKDIDDEAIRVIKNMPQWKPGTQDGKPVKVHYNIPIGF